MPAIRPSHIHPIPLRVLASEAGLEASVDAEISDITLDSRQVGPGALYVALPGTRAHGARFAASAVAAGAVAILTDARGAELVTDVDVPVLVSGRLRRDMARIASLVFGQPASGLLSLAVTGTNGKTTTVSLLEAALAAAGHRVGTIGTIGFRLDGVALPSSRGTVTTPESPDLHALLAVMAERGARTVAMEVSSHALKLERVSDIRFDVTAFLNLGHDHLDFHRDLEDYFQSKARLITPEAARRAVVWIDDPMGRELVERVGQGLRITTVGTTGDADYQLTGFEPVHPLGGRATVTRRREDLEIRIGLPGFHNMIDAAVALAMLELVDVDTADALAGLASAHVPGRMQRIGLDGEAAPVVIVDFAHTPQAVAATLDALQDFDHVITVVGCGGDRDTEKRPGMGSAAAARSDLVLVTDDNPRTEDPAAIRAATMAGAKQATPVGGRKGRVEEVAGRRIAIATALARAGSGSVVAILGKGHEMGQEVNGKVLPFDDAVETRRAWDEMGGGHDA